MNILINSIYQGPYVPITCFIYYNLKYLMKYGFVIKFPGSTPILTKFELKENVNPKSFNLHKMLNQNKPSHTNITPKVEKLNQNENVKS